MVSYAKTVNISFGYLFLNQLPQKGNAITHYRTIQNQSFTPSPYLTEMIDSVKEKQDWARDLLLERDVEPLAYAKKSKISDSVEETAKILSKVLELSGGWANSLTSWSDAFRLLVERTEAAGIFVVVNGVVNTNNTKALDVKEFRGFVLFDDIAPFVFINGKDSLSGKIFTLIHELLG